MRKIENDGYTKQPTDDDDNDKVEDEDDDRCERVAAKNAGRIINL